MNKIWALGVAVFMVIIIWSGFLSYPALSQQIESRLYSLEADVNRVESRLNQIESVLNQNRSSSSRLPVQLPQPQRNNRRNLSQQDPMFDRLATLVVELKQQVNKLESRVAKLESR
ncbi:hypothetical protein OGM63_07075 [Plectonema radiosum NIES-515]|uniref:Lipoyl synthase n=1 Tax=Plectonema radiosum NIES-515 TaxID=2986073 RepID=A0ABT3AVX1_9CYAN|nr:hypothetical protein [Plectonema radiosum]MCV3213287.1 hypothetical protein [Plectonema radiosum NIES-515]